MVPAFPPKKIFTLTPVEVEQRREQLEKYMQAGKFHWANQGKIVCMHLQVGIFYAQGMSFG